MMTNAATTAQDALYDLAPGTTASGRVSTLDDLHDVRALIEQAQRVQSQQVADLRQQGMSWAVIGNALGVSAQAAHKRYATT